MYVVVQEYFTTKRASAAAIASCGLSCGCLLFGPILRALIDALGWRGALLIFAGINFQLLIFAVLLRPLASGKASLATFNVSRQMNQGTKKTKNRCGDACSRILHGLASAFTISLLKDADCVLFLVIRCAGMISMNAMFMFGITRAVYLGVQPLSASFIATCMGVASTTARLTMAILASRLKFNHLLVAAIATTLSGLVAMLSTLARGEAWHHLVFATALGLFGGKYNEH